jgi:hypothetical protein
MPSLGVAFSFGRMAVFILHLFMKNTSVGHIFFVSDSFTPAPVMPLTCHGEERAICGKWQQNGGDLFYCLHRSFIIQFTDPLFLGMIREWLNKPGQVANGSGGKKIWLVFESIL